MNRNGFECAHLPNHVFFRTAQARGSDANRPHTGNFIEVPRGAGSMGDRTFAAELVETPTLAVSFVAERSRKPPGVEVRSPWTAFVDHAIIGELRTTILIQLRQLAHGDVFENNCKKVVRIGRTTGKVH